MGEKKGFDKPSIFGSLVLFSELTDPRCAPLPGSGCAPPDSAFRQAPSFLGHQTACAHLHTAPPSKTRPSVHASPLGCTRAPRGFTRPRAFLNLTLPGARTRLRNSRPEADCSDHMRWCCAESASLRSLPL